MSRIYFLFVLFSVLGISCKKDFSRLPATYKVSESLTDSIVHFWKGDSVKLTIEEVDSILRIQTTPQELLESMYEEIVLHSKTHASMVQIESSGKRFANQASLEIRGKKFHFVTSSPNAGKEFLGEGNLIGFNMQIAMSDRRMLSETGDSISNVHFADYTQGEFLIDTTNLDLYEYFYGIIYMAEYTPTD